MNEFTLSSRQGNLTERNAFDAGYKTACFRLSFFSFRKKIPLYASFQVPFFSLAVLLRDNPGLASGPVALVSSASDSVLSNPSTKATSVILAVNHAAAESNVTQGLSSTKALARCPHLNLICSTPVEEHLHQGHLREYLASLGSDFEETAPGAFILDLLPLSHAMHFPGEWAERALRKATPLRLPMNLALAQTPDLSIIAGRCPALRHTLRFNPDPIFNKAQYTVFDIRHISSRPVTSLHDISNEMPLEQELLSLWGIQTLGQFAKLPRQDLVERLGPGAGRAHDILHGKHHRLLRLYRPQERFFLSEELEYPLEKLEPLLFALNRGLRTLCSRLQSSQRAASSIKITLRFDDGNLHLRKLNLPEPTCRSSLLLKITQTHLETVHASAPVTGWSLQLTPADPGERQHHLFQRSLKDSRRFLETIGRLSALLGPERLGTPFLLDTHRPDSFQLKKPLNLDNHALALRQKKRVLSSSSGFTRNCASLPLSRFRPTLPIHVASHSEGRFPEPLALLNGPYCGPVTEAQGPFPLSGHWWDRDESWQQVEWDIQIASNALLRLAYYPHGNWVLEGVYQ